MKKGDTVKLIIDNSLFISCSLHSGMKSLIDDVYDNEIHLQVCGLYCSGIFCPLYESELLSTKMVLIEKIK